MEQFMSFTSPLLKQTRATTVFQHRLSIILYCELFDKDESHWVRFYFCLSTALLKITNIICITWNRLRHGKSTFQLEICDKAGENKQTKKKTHLQQGAAENSTKWSLGGFGLAAKSAKRTSSKQSRYNQHQLLWSPTDHMWNSCMHLREEVLISQSLELLVAVSWFILFSCLINICLKNKMKHEAVTYCTLL